MQFVALYKFNWKEIYMSSYCQHMSSQPFSKEMAYTLYGSV